MLQFQEIAKSDKTSARAGEFHLVHGVIKTPVFMPVGTLASVKSISPEELIECGAQIILGNTYHLNLRPGCDVVEKFSGLHGFMNWEKPILTDSGGFQIFSLAKLAKITEEGAAFQSHIDGSRHLLSPERAVDIQTCLDSDIMMCLDQCIGYPADWQTTKNALELTTRWARRCRDHWQQTTKRKNALFGIVQGGMHKDLRSISAHALADLDFPGYAIGGLSVGEPKDVMYEMADHTLPLLPDHKPKYIMGVGTPEDLVELVTLGADMFDCVLPSRNARNGQLITSSGNFNISNARFRHDTDPIDPQCTCYTCRNYSAAYLRHLYMAKELLAYRLNTIHNIHYFISLMTAIRSAIVKGEFEAFKKNFYAERAGGRET
ncbi:MAG: tRNA guanosine(34) transglycosylase Tgt [Deltaproteobacteria bacterium]|nr:tRNA guanosine(34) transglycosylase Tgt [Deltaproteobacteria bacterium]